MEANNLKSRDNGTKFVSSLEDAILEATENDTGCFHHYSGNDIAIGHSSGRYTIWLIGKGDGNNIQLGSVIDSLKWKNLTLAIGQLIYCCFVR